MINEIPVFEVFTVCIDLGIWVISGIATNMSWSTPMRDHWREMVKTTVAVRLTRRRMIM